MISELKTEKTGFQAVYSSERFKCAFIKRNENFSFGKVSKLKKHTETDEIFVLLKGKAVMLTLEGEKFTETPLITSSAFNVSKNTWHYLALSEDTEVFVVENADTTAENSEVLLLDTPYEFNE